MIFPRFTIRWLLALMVVVGVVSLVAASAVRALWNLAERQAVAGPRVMPFEDPNANAVGSLWAVGVCAALLALAFIFMVYAAVFLAASPLTLLEEVMRGPRPATTPFATAEPPPQILPPPEPE